MEKTLHSERIYNGKILDLRVDIVELPSGNTTKREIVEHDACTAIVGIDSNGKVLLVRQYRKPVEKTLLEIPAGGIERGEDPLKGARREFEEETGFTAESWEKLSVFYTSPGFCTEQMHLYLATDLKPVKRERDADESIELVPTPAKDIMRLIDSGEICDAKSIAGLLLAMRKKKI